MREVAKDEETGGVLDFQHGAILIGKFVSSLVRIHVGVCVVISFVFGGVSFVCRLAWFFTYFFKYLSASTPNLNSLASNQREWLAQAKFFFLMVII